MIVKLNNLLSHTNCVYSEQKTIKESESMFKRV